MLTVLVPLVLPEFFIVALIVGPVFLHVGQKFGPALLLKNGSDVRVLARLVAELPVAAIAIIRPRHCQFYPLCFEYFRTNQSPWMVQESEGPLGGFVSQNCVCRRAPPGELKQQESATAVEF